MTAPRDDASERQVQAAHPTQSTWVAANAGSGKTRVLIDRVARLLLQGTEPQRILCLTYTKAAATEMQNRLFQRLGAWAMLEDDKLRTDLAQLGEPARPSGEDLARARRLFARALETPGGLRIQTIHSFCATLLRRFPLEAGISPGFAELDDRAARLLRAQIVEEMAETRAPEVMAEVAAIYSGEDFTQLMEQVANARHGFARPVTEAAARQVFGVPQDETETRIAEDVLGPGIAAQIARVIPALRGKGKTDNAAANDLAIVPFDVAPEAVVAALEAALLTKSKTKPKKFPTMAAKAALGADFDGLDALMDRLVDAVARKSNLFAARKTAALHRFATAFLPLYENAKSARGWLDFDDLIARAKGLLTDRSVAAWVLYRLDGGIDHILVDEAQDTSPDQWRVIELLAEEFTAGKGARHDRPRTLFVVGDKKQSIYSFQGADIAAFDDKHALFRSRFAAVERPLLDMELLHSFRSAPAILRLVDMTFAGDFPQALGGAPQHLAFREHMPGRVDLWPLIEPVKTDEDENWDDPVDLVSETHHTAQLANQIAAEIRQMIDKGTAIVDGGKARPVHAGDFLVLVQRRSAIFDEIIRACKQQALPIAGADRLKLGGELAVKDLAALLSFLATPEDDLSLAAVLRSPLCGWGEDDLFRLAHGRKGYLWEEMRHKSAESDAFSMLRDLRDQADFLRPFDLLDRVLTRHKGRQRLLARLGDEAEDGIDELLSQALAYEQTEVPSLTGFLIWMETDEITVKRQMDGAGDKIRVMTVHGAKGLEAPIVILPDTADRNPRDRDEIYMLENGLPVWKTPADASPPAIQDARARRKADQAAESARLLYVALTRPRVWLIVAGAGEAKTDTKEGPKPVQDWSWYRLVERGMRAAGAEPTEGGRLRLANGEWPADLPSAAALAQASPPLPDWAKHPAPDAARPAQPLSPSSLGGAKALAGESLSLDEEAAKARGTAVHLLLEHLPHAPRDQWPAIASALIADPGTCRDALDEARRLLLSPDLAWLFAPGTLAEASFCARIGESVIHGSIDRLIVAPDRVTVVDFKSNSVVPAHPEGVPEGILRQLGAYAAAMAQVYPDRRIETCVLWTRTGQLMPVDPEIVSAALHRAAIP